MPLDTIFSNGSIYEGHTLIPVIEKSSAKFNLSNPLVVADAGLLSVDTIKSLEENGYEYILGARPKNETKGIKKKILKAVFKDGQKMFIRKGAKKRLIISY
jgi:transposase